MPAWGEGTDDISVTHFSEPFPVDSNGECGGSVLPLKMKGKFMFMKVQKQMFYYIGFSQKFCIEHFMINISS